MRIPSLHLRRRSAFTLIELLTVIAIIAILCAMSAGVVFRVMSSQYNKRTEATVKKVQGAFDQQLKAVVDDAHEETRKSYSSITASQKQALLNLASNDRDRAAVIWLKLRIKQEFPQTFFEVLNWSNSPAPGIPPMNNFLPVKQAYFLEIQGATAAPLNNPNPRESAALLYLALTQTRRGVTFSADEIGGAVKVENIGGKDFKIIVDAWGSPITFERWTTDTALITELSGSGYPAPVSGHKDPQDPMGKLIVPGQPNPAYLNTIAALLHPVSNPTLNRGPVIRSWGPDKLFNTNDDILGFRLMIEGQRGN
jgi:prepilin-type N-terminal cleavage/methylation domain-containing protein